MKKRTLEEITVLIREKSLPLIQFNKLPESEKKAFYMLLDEQEALTREANKNYIPKSSIEIQNKEVSFANGAVLSHVDGKYYSNRKDWDSHLKAHKCVEVGNDYKHYFKSSSEVKGDFTVRDDLTKVVKGALERGSGYDRRNNRS